MTDWYWVRGLHDAELKNVIFHQLDYDYTERNPIRNYIELRLDSSQAMFDTSIKAIRLYNAKIISGDLDCVNWFWKKDVLTQEAKKFVLDITFMHLREFKNCRISFEKAEVER